MFFENKITIIRSIRNQEMQYRPEHIFVIFIQSLSIVVIDILANRQVT